MTSGHFLGARCTCEVFLQTSNDKYCILIWEGWAVGGESLYAKTADEYRVKAGLVTVNTIQPNSIPVLRIDYDLNTLRDINSY
jgi:hypothetical protein